MENSEFLEGSRVGDGSIQPSSTFKGSENPGDEILVDLDSYFKDVNDILMISRMVSNSVIKGIVNAVTEETAEEIALKELEMASLKERLQFYVLGGVHGVENFQGSRFSDTVIEKGSMEECVSNLKIAEEKQFRMLEKEIEEIKESEKWVWGLDRTLDTVKNIRETFYERVDHMVYLSKMSFCEWQQEREFQDELENMVIQNFVRGLQEEFEAKLWEQRAQFHCSKNINQMKNMNELSCLRQELDAISRSLSSPEMGQLPPHGSHDELANSTTPEIIQDSSQLRHMPKDELIKYFKDEMTKMKRNHESRVHGITEEYFTLKRDFLKERGGPSRKDKESEVLRKRISEIILKVDDILTENVDLPVAYEVNTEHQSTLNDRVESLLSENRHLKDLLTDKRKEVKCLSSQVTDAVEKISNHSLVEANLLNQIRKLKCEVKCLSSQVTDAVDKISNHSLVEANLLNQIWKLKCDIEDMNIEVSVREDIYKSMLKDWIGEIKSDKEYSNMEFITMLEICEINFREAVENCKNTAKWDIKDSDLELIIMQEMCGVIFREAVKDAEGIINFMQMKYDEESKRRVSLEEALLLEREKTLSLEIDEKERLKKEKILFSALMDEKENLALEARHTLMKERERYDLLNKECSELRVQTSQQERLISENSRKLNLVNNKLEDVLVKMYSYEEEIKKLNQEIQSAMEDLKEANEEKRMLHNNIQEKEKTITLIEANEMEYKKQIEFIVGSIEGIYKEAADYECRALETVEKNSLRLEKLKFQCNQLVGKATLFRRMELVYKQRLEKRYSDLEKAEAEVDLLGDEVDALLSLLEKIYIALDHYSPILQHYPGVVEILKLVRRELSGETAKSV